MPIICFGGSFNPIHYGHITPAQAVAAKAGFDRVRLIPSAQPPHKPDAADLAPAADRLAMCQLAADWANAQTPAGPRFEVDDIETRRTGPSYTIDTVSELKRQGFDSVHWLIGADMLLSLPRWHRPADLLQEVQFVVMARPGFTLDFATLPPEFRHLQAQVVEVPLIPISATDIRERVRRSRPITALTPPVIGRYIFSHGLYLER